MYHLVPEQPKATLLIRRDTRYEIRCTSLTLDRTSGNAFHSFTLLLLRSHCQQNAKEPWPRGECNGRSGLHRVEDLHWREFQQAIYRSPLWQTVWSPPEQCKKTNGWRLGGEGEESSSVDIYIWWKICMHCACVFHPLLTIAWDNWHVTIDFKKTDIAFKSHSNTNHGYIF